MAVNKVILIGNLGKDPEVRHLENGRAVANFPLATSETYKNRNGERVTTTEWHNIVLWSPLAEIAEKYFQKGKQVYIEGKLQTRSYDDKDGIRRYTTEVVGQNFSFLGTKGEGGAEDNAPDSTGQQPAAQGNKTQVEEEYSSFKQETETDDLPF